MGPLFIQLIEKAKKDLPGMFGEEDWNTLARYTKIKELSSLQQLEALVPLIYLRGKGNHAAEQLITNIITTFLVLAKPSPQDYEELIQIFVGIQRGGLVGEYLQQLIKDLVALRANQIIKEGEGKQDFIEFLATVDPKNTYFKLVEKTLNERDISPLQTSILSAPFSPEKGQAYIDFVSNLMVLQKDNNLSAEQIDQELNSKLLTGNCITIQQCKDFSKFVLAQFATAGDKTVHNLLMEKLADRLKLSGYIEVVKYLIEEKPKLNVEAFLTATLSAVAKKLKDADSRLQFIKFVHETIKAKLNYSSPVLNECVEKAIKDQLGKDFNIVEKNLQEIKALEIKINQLEIPKTIVGHIEKLGKDFLQEFNQAQDRLLKDKMGDRPHSFSISIETQLSSTEPRIFSALSSLADMSNALKEELAEVYVDHKESVEALSEKVNTEFKQQISSVENEKNTLSKKVKELTEKETSLLRQAGNIGEEVKRSENSKPAVQKELNNLFKGSARQRGFLAYLKNDMAAYVDKQLKDINKELKANRRAQWRAGIRRGISQSLVLRALVLFSVPKTEKVQQQLDKLKEREKALIERKNAIEEVKTQVGKLSVIEDPASEAGQLAFSQSKAILEQLNVDMPMLFTASLIGIEAAQIAYQASVRELELLKGENLSLREAIKTTDKARKESITQLQHLTEKLDVLKDAYQKYRVESMEDFLVHWREEHALLPESKIDFSQHLDLVNKLHQCISNGDLEGTKQLLRNAQNWDIPQNQGSTPLQLALLDGQIDIAKFLIEQGANVKPPMLPGQNTPLFLAYLSLANASEENKSRFSEVFDALKDKGAQFLLDEIDKEKNTVLHLAVRNGDVERVKQWVERQSGAIQKITGLFKLADLPINQQNAQGETALHLALKANNLAMVNYLLEQGVDITIKNANLQMPFETPEGANFLSILDENMPLSARLAEILASSKAEPKQREEKIPVPPVAPSAQEHQEVTKTPEEVLPLPKETATKEEVVETPIEIDQLPIWLEEISTSNFSEDSEREKWINIFKKASFKQQWELVNAQDKNGDTLLHVAVKRKDLESVDLLVKHNPDMMIKNGMSQTVLGLADANWQKKADTWEYFFKVELPRDIAGAETSKPIEQKIYESIRNCSSRQDYSYKSSILIFNGMGRELGRVLTEYGGLLSDKISADNARFVTAVKKMFEENPKLIKDYESAYKFMSQGIEDPERLARLKRFLLSKQETAQMLTDSGVLLADKVNADNVQFTAGLRKKFEENQKLIKNHETAYQRISQGVKDPKQLAKLKGFLLNRQQVEGIIKETNKLLGSVKEQIVKMKIEAKRAPWCENEVGNNLFHGYTNKGNINFLERNLTIWIQSDPSRLETTINQTNTSGYTPLHLAVAFAASGVPQDQEASLKMVELLVEKGADINVYTEVDQENGTKKVIGEPALNIAIKVDFFKEGSLPIFDYLLSKGANVNLKDSQGETALHILARRTDEAAVYMVTKLLARADSKIDMPNNNGETALQIAQQCGNRGFIDLCEKNQKLSKLGWAKTTFFAEPSSENQPAVVQEEGATQSLTSDFKALRAKARMQKEEQKQPELDQTPKTLHQ